MNIIGKLMSVVHVYMHVKLKLSCSVHAMDYSDNLSVLLIVHI